MKGQMVSVDGLAAIAIFTVLITFVLFFSNTVDYRASNIEEIRVAKEKLLEISDRLIITPGDPTFWHINDTSIKSIGLAYEDHKLSSDKLYGLNTTSKNDYQNLRSLLNIVPYDTYIEFISIDETRNCTITSGSTTFNLTAGKFPNGQTSISITRIVKDDSNRFCKLRIWAWK